MIQNLRTMESLLIPLIASRLVVGTFLCCFGLRLFPLLSFLIGGGGTFLLSCSLFNHYFSEPHSGSTFLIAGILSISVGFVFVHYPRFLLFLGGSLVGLLSNLLVLTFYGWIPIIVDHLLFFSVAIGVFLTLFSRPGEAVVTSAIGSLLLTFDLFPLSGLQSNPIVFSVFSLFLFSLGLLFQGASIWSSCQFTKNKVLAHTPLTPCYPLCFRCELVLVPPIFVGQSGQSLCSKCHDHLTGEDGQFFRNSTLEHILQSANTNCPFFVSGCPFSSDGNEMVQHSFSCRFRPHFCPFCSVLSKTTQDLVKHLREKHDIITQSGHTISIDVAQENTHWSWTVRENGAYFLLRIDFSDGILKVAAADLSRFHAHLLTCSIEGETSVRFTIPCQDASSGLSQHDGVWLPLHPNASQNANNVVIKLDFRKDHQ